MTQSFVNRYLDKIYCLNLNKRTDRWDDSVLEFKKHNLDVERFEATSWEDVFPGTAHIPRYRANIAHLHSFVRFFHEVIEKDLSTVLLLEDDVCFAEDLNSQFEELIKVLPEDWGMLYLGGNHNGGFYFTEDPRVIKCVNTLSTHAIVFKKPFFQTILYNLQHHLTSILDIPPPTQYTPYVGSDVWLGILQQVIPTYSFNPPLAWQKADYSDIEMKQTDSSHLLKYKF